VHVATHFLAATGLGARDTNGAARPKIQSLHSTERSQTFRGQEQGKHGHLDLKWGQNFMDFSPSVPLPTYVQGTKQFQFWSQL
jgi:hypothetical protein